MMILSRRKLHLQPLLLISFQARTLWKVFWICTLSNTCRAGESKQRAGQRGDYSKHWCGASLLSLHPHKLQITYFCDVTRNPTKITFRNHVPLFLGSETTVGRKIVRWGAPMLSHKLGQTNTQLIHSFFTRLLLCLWFCAVEKTLVQNSSETSLLLELLAEKFKARLLRYDWIITVLM